MCAWARGAPGRRGSAVPARGGLVLGRLRYLRLRRTQRIVGVPPPRRSPLPTGSGLERRVRPRPRALLRVGGRCTDRLYGVSGALRGLACVCRGRCAAGPAVCWGRCEAWSRCGVSGSLRGTGPAACGGSEPFRAAAGVGLAHCTPGPHAPRLGLGRAGVPGLHGLDLVWASMGRCGGRYRMGPCGPGQPRAGCGTRFFALPCGPGESRARWGARPCMRPTWSGPAWGAAAPRIAWSRTVPAGPSGGLRRPVPCASRVLRVSPGRAAAPALHVSRTVRVSLRHRAARPGPKRPACRRRRQPSFCRPRSSS